MPTRTHGGFLLSAAALAAGPVPLHSRLFLCKQPTPRTISTIWEGWRHPQGATTGHSTHPAHTRASTSHACFHVTRTRPAHTHASRSHACVQLTRMHPGHMHASRSQACTPCCCRHRICIAFGERQRRRRWRQEVVGGATEAFNVAARIGGPPHAAAKEHTSFAPACGNARVVTRSGEGRIPEMPHGALVASAARIDKHVK